MGPASEQAQLAGRIRTLASGNRATPNVNPCFNIGAVNLLCTWENQLKAYSV